MPPPRPRDIDEALDRLQALETRVLLYEERTNQRLNRGSESFAEMKAVVSDLRPKRQAILPWAAVAIAIGGILFRAGAYPDRAEVERVAERAAGATEELKAAHHALEREMVRVISEGQVQREVDQKRIERLENEVTTTRIEMSRPGRR